ncbi:MAG TPA: hypothetical protein VGG89_08465 [Candidatus Baltobacteraceae bacterium]|jgi:hypothetical protein
MKTRFVAALAAVVVLAACGHRHVSSQNAGGNAASNASGSVVVNAGTTYYGKLDKAIGTKVSHDGDTFTLTHTDTFFHKNPALDGAVIDAHVENVRAAGPMRNPAMTIVFDDIRLPDGTKEPVNASIVSWKEFDPKTHHLRTIGMMFGGAIAGHMTHRKHGGLMGAAGGYALSQTLKTDVQVPAGTVVELRLNQAVTKSSG